MQTPVFAMPIDSAPYMQNLAVPNADDIEGWSCMNMLRKDLGMKRIENPKAGLTLE